MNFKKNIILGLTLFIYFSSLLIASDRYKIELHVDDPEERYRVEIKLLISDEHQVESANFIYPDYECKGHSIRAGWSNNTIDIKEKITKGICDSTYYLFYFTPNGQEISSIQVKNGRKYITTRIESINIDRNVQERQKDEDKNTYYRNGNIKCKTDNGIKGNFDSVVECFYENGSKKHIVKFRLGKAVKGTIYNRDGSSKKMTEADFSNMGYDYGTGTTNENGSIQNLDN